MELRVTRAGHGIGQVWRPWHSGLGRAVPGLLRCRTVIALVDYGSGNLRSVFKALRHVGAEVRIVRRPEELRDARAAVLPGVGAFDDCIRALERQELLGALRAFIASGRPFLGICVGYQALFERSEEFNSCAARAPRNSSGPRTTRTAAPTRNSALCTLRRLPDP
jgi:hypothetical protein